MEMPPARRTGRPVRRTQSGAAVSDTGLSHPAVSAALSTAATLIGMELVFVGGLTEQTFTFRRVVGELPGVYEGRTLDLADTFCARVLEGAPAFTCDAATDPYYADVPARSMLNICSYVGVPIRSREGTPLGTLCGIDRGVVPVEEATMAVLTELAEIVGAHLDGDEDVVIRRTPTGWHVTGTDEPADDLTSAMVLADILAEDCEAPRRPVTGRPDDELSQLRLQVTQLEHALTARVVVEQAIGVLAERHKVSPRSAFEQLRRASRSRGRRVHDLAREVVASTAPGGGAALPPELATRR